MILRTLVVGAFGTNCYVLGCETTGKGAIVDPGDNASAVLEAAQEAQLDIILVINTHSHIDHTGANGPVAEATGAKIAIHELDAGMLADPRLNLGAFVGRSDPGPRADQLLREGDVLQVGEISLAVLHTPGHTPGGISLYSEGEAVVFTGDALFQGSIGRTDFPGGNHAQLLESIRTKLLTLPPETRVYSGHGSMTTIGREKEGNPWL